MGQSDSEGTQAEASDQASIVPLNEIQVSGLRTTFFWPLTLDATSEGKPVAAFDNASFLKLQEDWLLEDKSPWQRVDDGLFHLRLPDASMPDAPKEESDHAAASPRNEAMANAYGEFVYFHDFVQRALYGKTGGVGAGPLRLYQRSDIKTLEFQFDEKDQPRAFAVERVNLYLLSYGVAVIAVQCRSQPSPRLSLADVLRFNDSMRCSHVPFFENADGMIQSRRLPKSVVWHLHGGKPAAFEPDLDGVEIREVSTPDTDEKRHIRTKTPYTTLVEDGPEHRRALPARHWRWLLNGEEDDTERMPLCKERNGYRWRHFSDDRLPILSTVILAECSDYYAMSDGHWMRLAFVDQPGSNPFPYAEAFLRDNFKQHCYDRYHHPEALVAAEKADPPSRYLICDYAMTAVTYQAGNDYAGTLEVHMQRHYYQMFLLQVIDKAVMLGLSSRITRAVERFDSDRPDKRPDKAEADLSTDLQDIERDFLLYVHRFRFTGVSGQLQAGELFAQMRGLMRLDAMFADIKTELETAVAFLSGREARYATEAAERLNIIASLGIVVALVLGFFSMNILTTKELIEDLFGSPAPLPWWRRLLPAPAEPAGDALLHFTAFGIGLMVVSSLAWILSHAIAAQTGAGRLKSRPAEIFVRRGLFALFLIGSALAAVGLWPR